MNKELICAQAAHEMNRVYCQAIGDNSQVKWENAPTWQKESAINGVKGVMNGNTPEQSHQSWLIEKIATGWKYGPIKNPDTKEHPCMVSYDQLSEDQRVKDLIFVNTVKLMLDALKDK